VLHLEPGVHLQEVELAVLVEELDRARVDVAAGAGDLHGRLAHGLAHLVGELGGRALLDQLLVAALRRAVALAEPHRVAVGVGEDLHLDVAGPGQVALDVALGAAEALERLRLRRLQSRRRFRRRGHHPHAPAPAAVGRLDGHRPAVLLAEGHHLVGRGEELGGAGHAGHARLLGGDAGRHLVPHDLDGLGRGTDEGHAPGGDGPREVGVLAEEAVAGVDAVGAGALDDVEDLGGVEVALARRPAPERVGLIGQPDVEAVTVEVRVDGDRCDAELAAGAHDPHRDFAPVGDQDLREHIYMFTGMPEGGASERARALLAGTRFADVRWVSSTGSTNADVLALARDGAPEGIVVVADHQTAGRGRRDRRWVAPPGASLLLSVLLRPPSRVAGLVTLAAGVALAEAVEQVAGVRAGLKWPNDLVAVVGGEERKLAGILAEADWPTGTTMSGGYRPPAPTDRVVVVVGVGINVVWPRDLSGEAAEVAEVATALNWLGTGVEVDRADLLVGFLRALTGRYATLVSARPADLLDAWRSRSATLGRRVRVDLGRDDLEGTAVDITEEGHLVVETREGDRRTVTVGDVVHLRAPLG
jgi:BirA family biotin operon repressor/biotin-[acetyl-CoA-carboxylase] ligase